MNISLIFCCLVFSLCCQPLAAQSSWSAELLKEVLETRGRTEGQPDTDRRREEGLILRSYQLKHLRVGESKRGKNALQLLTRLLPQGSSIKVDMPANSIHLLASVSAQAAAWDFLSSLDIPNENPQVSVQDLSPTLQNVLQQLEEAKGGNKRLAEAMGRIEEDLQHDRRLRAQAEEKWQLWPYAAAAISACGALMLWLLSTKRKQGARLALAQSEKSLGLMPHELLGSAPSHSLQQRELQQEMLGAINAAAIRMEVWYNEQKSQRDQVGKVIADQELALRQAQSCFAQTREQLLNENKALLDKAGSRFEASAEKLEINVQHLGKQHERVEALACELQTTVQELDQTKDEILRLQSLLEKRGDELDKTRERLSHREGELCHQQAKLAALTLILEESQWPEIKDSKKEEMPESPSDKQGQEACEIVQVDPSLQAETTNYTHNSCTATPPKTYFQFLPPDKAEN